MPMLTIFGTFTILIFASQQWVFFSVWQHVGPDLHNDLLKANTTRNEINIMWCFLSFFYFDTRHSEYELHFAYELQAKSSRSHDYSFIFLKSSQTSESDTTVSHVNASNFCNAGTIMHQFTLHYDVPAQCFCFSHNSTQVQNTEMSV